MDSESLPTGMVIPRAVHSSAPTARTVAYSRRILAGLAARGHPVGGQTDVGELAHIGAQDVGDGLAHGQPSRRRCIEHGHRRTLAHGHRLAGISLIVLKVTDASATGTCHGPTI